MIGNQIKYYRQEKHIKQDELAEYLGVSFQAVSKWETGASTPDISLLPKLAVFFGISIDELFEMPYQEQMDRIENMIWSERRINEKTFTSSISFLENVISNDPKDTRALGNLAYLYNHRAKSDHELASHFAQQVLELDPDDKCGWVAYLEANNGLCGDEWYDNHFEVIAFFKEFLEKNPLNYSGLYALLENLMADSRFDEAAPYIEQIKKARKNHMYLLYKGDVAFGKGNRDEARGYWEQMVKDFPETWQAYNSLGEGYLKLGEKELALEMFEKSFSMQEGERLFDGLCAMAQVYEADEEYDKAIKCYQRIIDCLKTDYDIKEGEQVDSFARQIARLKKY